MKTFKTFLFALFFLPMMTFAQIGGGGVGGIPTDPKFNSVTSESVVVTGKQLLLTTGKVHNQSAEFQSGPAITQTCSPNLTVTGLVAGWYEIRGSIQWRASVADSLGGIRLAIGVESGTFLVYVINWKSPANDGTVVSRDFTPFFINDPTTTNKTTVFTALVRLDSARSLCLAWSNYSEGYQTQLLRGYIAVSRLPSP